MRRRSALPALVAAAAVAASLAPGAPGRHLAGFRADGPDPNWDVPLDGAAIRRAGRIVPDDTTYALYAPTAGPVLAGNLKAAAQLFLVPALPVPNPLRARWILSYHAPSAVPAGVEARRTYHVGRRVYLVRVA